MQTLIQTPFNYTGSKFKLLPQILPLFDYSKPYFVDTFMGGGSVYTNVLDKYERIWANDIIKELVAIHEKLAKDIDNAFVDKVKSLCVAKDDQEGYVKLRTTFNRDRLPEQLFALMLCCTNNMMRFNQSFEFNQTFGKRTFNKKTEEKIAEFQKHLDKFLHKVHYTSLNFKLIQPSKAGISKCMFYFDPPYFNTEAGYNAYWSEQSEQDLFDYIIEIDKSGASFALSGIMGEHKGNPQSQIITKLLDNDYKGHILNFDYEKVARNKEQNRGTEILITNY